MQLSIDITFFLFSFDYEVFLSYAVTNVGHPQEISIFDLS